MSEADILLDYYRKTIRRLWKSFPDPAGKMYYHRRQVDKWFKDFSNSLVIEPMEKEKSKK